MALAPILHILGWFLCALATTMLPPAFVDLGANNPDWRVFFASGGVTFFIGSALILANRQGPLSLSLRHGFVLTTACWFTIVLFGALPFFFSDTAMTWTDSVFEAMSGLTTTGSTVMIGLDKTPPGLLLWRGELQWFGGIGIIVMGIAMLPFLKVGGMQIFRMESSDKSEKIIPQPQRFTLVLFVIYCSLTGGCALLLGLAGLSSFDAVIHAMTTVSTGGFSTSDLSVGQFRSPAVEWIITAFMYLSALPFVHYIQALQGDPERLYRASQVRRFTGFLIVVILTMASWLWLVDGFRPMDSLRLAAFNVTSVVTTTGYATADYGQWGSMPVGLFFLLTFIGGCSGSTAGGIKMFRFEVLWVSLKGYLWHRHFPHGVGRTEYDGKTVTTEISQEIGLFVLLFLAVTAITSLVLEAVGLDLVTAITAAATAVANVGPGLGPIIGPSGNFDTLPDLAKWVLALAMLLGRLEFFTVLVLLTPSFWRH